MPKPRNSRSERPRPSAKRPAGATPSIASQTLIPIGAVLLSGAIGAFAQEAPAVEAKTLPSVTVREKAAPEQGRNSLRVTVDFKAHVGEATALQGELPLQVDGGIRRGTDVLKALALVAALC